MSGIQPECPRCGYDLSGTPQNGIEGTCPECGLLFTWDHVLNPDRQRVPGFIEHARSIWQWPWWSWRTLLSSFHAARFWRLVRLETASRPSLWPAYVLCTVGLPWLIVRLYILWLCGCWWFLGANTQAYVPFLIESLTGNVVSRDVQNRNSVTYVFDPWELAHPGTLAAFTVCVMMPCMLVVLPYTRAQLKIRWQHVARAGVFGSLPVWLALMLTQTREIIGYVDHYGFTGQSPGGTLSGLTTNDLSSLWWGTLMFVRDYQFLLAATACLWIFWWWAMALSRGFRATNWFAILAAQSIAALLASMCVALAHPETLWLFHRVLS